MPDEHVTLALQRLFRRTSFRVYASTDVTGVEIAGALKNVFAIAAGMCAGLSTGDNTRALVIARSLAEMTRLGVAMGGDRHTFAGLAGMGDLLATCISPLSRNRNVGEELAKGKTIEQITGEMKMVAEGIKTSATVMELAERHGVEMPIAREVYEVVNEGRSAQEAFRGLLRTTADDRAGGELTTTRPSESATAATNGGQAGHDRLASAAQSPRDRARVRQGAGESGRARRVAGEVRTGQRDADRDPRRAPTPGSSRRWRTPTATAGSCRCGSRGCRASATASAPRR